jgi:hypothetical protein
MTKIIVDQKPLTAEQQLAKVKAILEKHECCSDEQMAQSDYHSINGVDIIIEICEVVGYAKCPYDDEDESED